MAQGGEHGFGDFVPVLAAEFFVAAEIGGNEGVGGLLEAEHLAEQGGGVEELGRGHLGVVVSGSLGRGKAT